MKKFITLLAIVFCGIVPAFAQASANYFPDSIIGLYQGKHEGTEFKVRIEQNADGTFSAKLVWVKDCINPETGRKRMDVKNPDKSKRYTPLDEVEIITGLKYNEEKKCWDKGRMYDPSKGKASSISAFFEPDDRLSVKGKLLARKEYWRKIEE